MQITQVSIVSSSAGAGPEMARMTRRAIGHHHRRNIYHIYHRMDMIKTMMDDMI